jgi:hypothetical protein
LVHVTAVPTGTVSVTGPKLKLSIFTSIVDGFCCARVTEPFRPVPKTPIPNTSAAAKPVMNTLLLMFLLLFNFELI